MQSYGTAYARAHFCDLIRRAEAGETIEITKGGKPVMLIEPPEGKPAKVAPRA